MTFASTRLRSPRLNVARSLGQRIEDSGRALRADRGAQFALGFPAGTFGGKVDNLG